jgi:Tfp pilus assembly protein PilV
MQTKKGATLVGSLVAVTILATTLVAVLNLQVSIIRAKFFLQYDNTANLLVAEGLEIVRAIYANGGNIPTGNNKYQVDYKTTALDSTKTSSCDETLVLNSLSCDMDLATPQQSYGNSSFNGYVICQASGDCVLNPRRVFHRFVTINNPNPTTAIPKVTSTVIVRNPKGGSLRVYKATIELYKIN